jgi:hypothetical protein
MPDSKLKLSALALALAAVAATAACEEMNRPAYVPKARPRHECFSDVECPGGKCFKGPNDVQGVCGQPQAAPGASDAGPQIVIADGGAEPPALGAPPSDAPTATPTGAPAPPPPPPSPNDTQL